MKDHTNIYHREEQTCPGNVNVNEAGSDETISAAEDRIASGAAMLYNASKFLN